MSIQSTEPKSLSSSICELLVAAWQRGKRTSIEEFLALSVDWRSLAEEEQRQLLLPLIQFEIELARQYGQSPQLEDYRERFDGRFREEVEELFILPALPRDGLALPMLPERFRLVSEIGRGGIGCVWRVIDRKLNRTMAIKTLKPEHRDRPAANQRMHREARLTGALQHPGIPPLHDVGVLSNGSIYFSMKLVEGRTLAELLEQRKGPDSDLPHFLAIFEQIAQAIAYAHSQRIIHRDLKPQNFMVGRFGEVQVMDWGMAISLEEAIATTSGDTETADANIDLQDTPSDAASATALNANADTLGDEPQAITRLTRDGEILGTPAYMPPEQAVAGRRHLSLAVDVFALGGILFEILTGERLYRRRSDSSVLAQAAACDLVEPLKRLDVPHVDPTLRALCRECLAADPEARPATAELVTDRVTAYLADAQNRRQQAEIERSSAEAVAHEAQKRQRTVLAFVGAIGAITLLGVVGVVWQWSESRAAERLAETRLAETRQAVDEYFTVIADDRGLLSNAPGTQELRRTLLRKAEKYYQQFLLESGDDPALVSQAARAYSQLGKISAELSPGSSDAIDLYRKANRLLDTLTSGAGDGVERLVMLSENLGRIGMVYQNLQQEKEALDVYQEAIQVALRVLEEEPSPTHRMTLAKHRQNLAMSLGKLKRNDEALELFQQAASMADSVIDAVPDDPELLHTAGNIHSNLGVHFGFSMKNKQQGLVESERSLEVRQRLVKLAPDSDEFQNALASSYNNVGLMLHFNGRKDESLVAFEEAVEVRSQVVRRNPSVPLYAEKLMETYNNLGTLHAKGGRPRRAVEYYHKSYAMIEDFMAENPRMLRYVSASTEKLRSIIQLQYGFGEREQAFEVAEWLVDLLEVLVERQPGRVDWKFDLVELLAVLRDDVSEELFLLTDSGEDETAPRRHRVVRAMAHCRRGAADEARRLIASVAEAERDALWWLVDGWCALEMGEQENATDSLQSARRIMDGEPYPRFACLVLYDELLEKCEETSTFHDAR